MYTLYVLLCADNTLYTGITNNLKQRMGDHRNGTGSRYVRSRLPFKLIYKEKHPDRSSATKREIEIKGWTRKKNIKTLM